MFKHILVPLDGSHLAEAALPFVFSLAKSFESTVTLIHIIEKNAPPAIHGDRHLTNKQDAVDYLANIQSQYSDEAVAVDAHVHEEIVSDISQSIVDHAGEMEPDLIVMCTHGETGLRDLVIGSMAEQVINRGKTPILLIRPETSPILPVKFGHLLVALDGEPEHEASLGVAANFARITGASLHLLHVVNTFETLSGKKAAAGRMLPGTTKAMLELTVAYGEEFLLERARILIDQDLAVTFEVRRGEPAQQIVLCADSLKSDLVFLGTHGKSGMNAFWSGSVAPKVLANLKRPVLLVPVGK